MTQYCDRDEQGLFVSHDDQLKTSPTEGPSVLRPPTIVNPASNSIVEEWKLYINTFSEKGRKTHT